MALLRDLRLLLFAWLVLVIVRAALLLTNYRRIATILPSVHRAPPPGLARRVEISILQVSRFVPGSTCLAEACAGRILLAIKGFGATMRVGVRTASNGSLLAHAWLISDGEVILGSRVPAFGEYKGLADFS